ncbi:thiamine phosphate synthase [Microbacterium trichothecenolyticum]|uniref:Thiamine-phosphate synthase n=1 Tax=Microbacterium trichothecenolyticum TaxID=69370 RepID=A0ABU0TX79_MICTR|nr:thiamine phosphate synthase [Microbacterium trichothecenolyticum]MDQ1124272.1 thiamine-phosphate pyrophosphorylase [Microbacterium trichothecenolyticum]
MSDFSLHLVTDHRVPFTRLRDIVDEAVTAGVSVVQLRDKLATGAELFARTLDLADVIAGRCAFVVDDRLDVVLAARDRGARVDGIHLGQSDMPVDAARALLGPDALVGWTANTPAHLAVAEAFPDATLDYLGVGVIRTTTTKPDHPRPLGVDGFAELAASTALPCVAIGGIDVGDVAALHAVGAAGVAVVSAVCAADDPGAVVRDLRAAWGGAA